ncbi:MAG: response regulator [Omnitrophica WOR_2 bacterium]
MINLLIVDDHILFREGLASLFSRQPDFQVVGEAGSVQEAIQSARQLAPDVILMDFSLPDGTGLDATKEILQALPQTKIVFLTMHEQDDRLFSAIRSGAKGYLLKNLAVTKLLAALRSLEQGEAPISGQMAAKILDEFSRTSHGASPDKTVLEPLSTRELEVFHEIVAGASNREIAGKLVISENTVKNHVHNILDKLQINSRREIAAFAADHGLK